MTEALSPHYRHRAKDAAPGTALRLGNAVLKWYDLDEPANRISRETRALAQDALQAMAATFANDIAGFAILHQCSTTFAFLLVSTWRGNNELWQSVLYIDQPLTAFAPFTPAYPATAPAPRPTFCVWELGIVAHEALAWQHFLASDRNPEELADWQADCLTSKV
jgi:hypothetical protein